MRLARGLAPQNGPPDNPPDCVTDRSLTSGGTTLWNVETSFPVCCWGVNQAPTFQRRTVQPLRYPVPRPTYRGRARGGAANIRAPQADRPARPERISAGVPVGPFPRSKKQGFPPFSSVRIRMPPAVASPRASCIADPPASWTRRTSALTRVALVSRAIIRPDSREARRAGCATA
jgi:hypothetical protein